MTRLLFSITLLMSIFYSCHLMAFEGSYQDAQEVRGSTDKILTSPEFRHLRGRFNSKSPFDRNSNGNRRSSSGSSSGSESGNGSERSGESGNSKNSTSGEQSGDIRDGDPNSDSEPFSSSNSSSMGSGLGGGLGVLVQFFFWAIIAVVVIAMLYFIVRALLDRDTSTKTEDISLSQESVQEEEPEQAPGEIPADVYITRARELAAQGLYNEAVAQLLLGAMSNIERAGLIQYRKGLTNRDYLRVIRSNKGPYQAFNLIVRTYEPIGFGRRNANETHFEKSLAGYEQGFRASL